VSWQSPIAVVLDVDGVLSPVGGHTSWGDDVVAGQVFGPAYTSPCLCARLDALATWVEVGCWWLTSWDGEMRAGMSPFPGRDWPVIADGSGRSARTGRRWWKRVALENWLGSHPEIRAIAWCDDHLRSPARQAAVRRSLTARGLDILLVAPATTQGLTPKDMEQLEEWLFRPSIDDCSSPPQTPEPVSRMPAPGAEAGPRGIGFRFRRPLTEDEFDAVVSAAKTRGKTGGLDGAFRATWDILLGEAEGMTLAEAHESGLKFFPAEYALPDSQAERLLGIWLRHRGPHYRQESDVGFRWMNMGPGSYPDETDGDTNTASGEAMNPYA
jgi:hypothetical protein